ncbi:Dihydroxy-acid/6-phosphogluconate dehydratase [Niveomyces insectorum RCEF 264]|uniref:Dihydroxy-acid/6-phosphogluconate dehydratase n=1 Tax=Niveomyces insectorum RCEF 264 TaxID=1081102 RepID=A0A167YZA7_9HYPO|nr:Dihydroxy-acid/6-phosphogluconate dehydratase [Niveomyces insectorum RCEF 264]
MSTSQTSPPVSAPAPAPVPVPASAPAPTQDDPPAARPQDPLADYDLSRPIQSTMGMRQGLISAGDPHFSLFLRKAFIKALGYSEDALSRPIIGIVNTYSGFNPCHANVPALMDAAKRGVQLSGGLAIDFPTISIHEAFSSPTSMFLRNLMSMDTEEMIRAQPVDACIVIGGCDKTVPAQLMGGISADKPVLPLLTGPMMPGSFKGERIGACTDCRNNWAAFRNNEMDIEDISALNEELAPTAGTCGVMGTASTMACLTAALGMIPLRGGATAPAVSSARLRIAEETGANAVAAALAKRTPQSVLSAASFHNALTVLQAIGGSTNGIVHLLAIANRHPGLRGAVTLQMLDDVGRRTPLLVDLKPSGNNYMTDLHNAGGMPALLERLRPLLRLDALTITGQTLGAALDAAAFRLFPLSAQIIRPLDDPLFPAASLVVLRGNLAPDGAVLKASASKDRRLLQHRGRAVVFAGPLGFASPGMPEAGLIPIPRKLGARGVKDMLRLSDGRMSGTAAASCCTSRRRPRCPRACWGWWRRATTSAATSPTASSRSRSTMRRSSGASKTARSGWPAGWASRGPADRRRQPRRGYRGLYERCVTQAQDGVDFDFLTADGAKALA